MNVPQYFETQLQIYTDNGHSDLAHQLLTSCAMLHKKTISATEFANIVDNINKEYGERVKHNAQANVPKVAVPRQKKVAKKRKTKGVSLPIQIPLVKTVTQINRTCNTSDWKERYRVAIIQEFRRRVLLSCHRLVQVRRADQRLLTTKIRKTAWPQQELYAVDTLTEREHKKHEKKLLKQREEEEEEEADYLVARRERMSNTAYNMATKNAPKTRKRRRPKLTTTTTTTKERPFNVGIVLFADALRFALSHPPPSIDDRLPAKFIWYQLERIQSGWSAN